MQVTVKDLIAALEDYPDDAKVLFIEHQYRGPGVLFRADDNAVLDLQRQFSYKPGLADPELHVVFNLTTLAMTHDYVSTDGTDRIRWPGKRE